MENTIDSIVNKLSFLQDTGAQYRAAIALQGAECPEAAIIHLKGAWERKERALIAELRKGSTAGTRPQRAPATRAEFDKMSYSERLWVFHNEPETYRRYTGKATKADIMRIKDPGERQAAIAENISLFIGGD